MTTAQRIALASVVSVIAVAGCVKTEGAKVHAANAPSRMRIMSCNVQHCEGPEKKFDLELGAMRRFMEVVSKENCLTFHGRKAHPPESEYCIDYIAIDSAHVANISVKNAYVKPDAVTSDHNHVVVELELVDR